MIKRTAISVLAGSLLFAGALVGNAEEGIPLCADIREANGTYVWTPGGTGQLELDVVLPPESPEVEPVVACPEVTYELWLVKDNPGTFPPAGDPTTWDERALLPIFEVGQSATEPVLLHSAPGDGQDNILHYSLTIEDDDPTICLFSRTLGTITTTTEPDDNGRGNGNAYGHDKDKAKGNAYGHHKDEEPPTTTTETVEYDRAPNSGCSAFNFLVDTITSAQSPGRGYN